MKTDCPFYVVFFLIFSFIQLLTWKYGSYQRKYCQFLQYEKYDRTTTCTSKTMELFNLLYWQREKKITISPKVTIILNIYLAKILKRHSCWHPLGILDAKTFPLWTYKELDILTHWKMNYPLNSGTNTLTPKLNSSAYILLKCDIMCLKEVKCWMLFSSLFKKLTGLVEVTA